MNIGSRVYIVKHQLVGTVIDIEKDKYQVKYLQNNTEKIKWFSENQLKEQPELPFDEKIF
jgi:hypothetical protein